jgi:hypothetical protein
MLFAMIADHTETPDQLRTLEIVMRATRVSTYGDDALIVKRLLRIFFDGLHYGNWPWTR